MKERNLGIQNLIDRQNEYLKLMKTQGGNKEEEINKRILKEREEKSREIIILIFMKCLRKRVQDY